MTDGVTPTPKEELPLYIEKRDGAEAAMALLAMAQADAKAVAKRLIVIEAEKCAVDARIRRYEAALTNWSLRQQDLVPLRRTIQLRHGMIQIDVAGEVLILPNATATQ